MYDAFALNFFCCSPNDSTTSELWPYSSWFPCSSTYVIISDSCYSGTSNLSWSLPSSTSTSLLHTAVGSPFSALHSIFVIGRVMCLYYAYNMSGYATLILPPFSRLLTSGSVRHPPCLHNNKICIIPHKITPRAWSIVSIMEDHTIRVLTMTQITR